MQKHVIAAVSVAGAALCGALGWWTIHKPEPRTQGLIVVRRSPVGPSPVPSLPPPVAAPAVEVRADPLANEPDQLFMKVRAEPRDEEWAAQAEATLGATLHQIPDIGHGRPLAITCGASTCEVSGSAANNDDYDSIQATWVKLRATIQNPELARARLVVSGSMLGTARDVAGFVVYFRRQPS